MKLLSLFSSAAVLLSAVYFLGCGDPGAGVAAACAALVGLSLLFAGRIAF